MDYNLCLLPSSQLYERSLFFFCTSSNVTLKISASPLKFNSSFSPSRSLLCRAEVSLQYPVAAGSGSGSSSSPLPRLTSPPSKNVMWVNPKSENASQILQRRQDPRYNPLIKLSNSLNSCDPTVEGVSTVLNRVLDTLVERDAITILNNMSNPHTARIVLDIFLQKLKPPRMVIFYNVTMKVVRKTNEFGLVEKLFDEMLERGVKPDNTTFSTIISCARLCALPDKALEWCEKMPTFECYPDAITYSAIIESYGRAGNIDTAISLFDRARNEGLDVDPVVLSMLIKFHGMSGYIGKCMRVYEGMKALGLKLNLVMYNNLLLALGRVRKAWDVSMICRDMADDGIEPNKNTYIVLLQIYSRARYGKNAIQIYRTMKEKGMVLSTGLVNMVLSVCADLGFVAEAVEIFDDMLRSGSIKPNIWTFSAMVGAYSCNGNVSEAEAYFDKMLEAGIQPNIIALNSLIQCYGKAKCTDKVLTTFDRAMDLGVTLDDQFFCSVLNVLTQTPREELDKLISCLGKSNSELAEFVRFLVDEKSLIDALEIQACKIFDATSPLMRKAYCNCFIDMCCNLNMPERARDLLSIGSKVGIYKSFESKTAIQWSLHLKTFSPGAAVVALNCWINGLLNSLKNGEGFPAILGIHTGHGRLAVSVLANAVKSRLEELDAPFRDDPEKVGWFLSTATAVVLWLESQRSPDLIASSS